MSQGSALETRRLDALPREESVDGLAMDAKNASHSHGVQSAVVDQTPDRLGVHTQLQRYLSDTDQTAVLSVYGRHNPREALQVLGVPAWADRTNSGLRSDYFR